jgi:hypothetical protein
LRKHLDRFGNPCSRTRELSARVDEPIDMRDADSTDGDATLIRVVRRFLGAFDLPRHTSPYERIRCQAFARAEFTDDQLLIICRWPQ